MGRVDESITELFLRADTKNRQVLLREQAIGIFERNFFGDYLNQEVGLIRFFDKHHYMTYA